MALIAAGVGMVLVGTLGLKNIERLMDSSKASRRIILAESDPQVSRFDRAATRTMAGLFCVLGVVLVVGGIVTLL